MKLGDIFLNKDFDDDLWDLKADAIKVLKRNALLHKDRNINHGFNYKSLKFANLKQYTLWNSCLNIISNSLLNPKRAREEFIYLLKNQQVNGFIRFYYYQHNEQSDIEKNSSNYSLTHPPLVATALRSIYDATSKTDFIKSYAKYVNKYFDHLYESRISEDNNFLLLDIKHPLENPITNSFNHKQNFKKGKIRQNLKNSESKKYLNGTLSLEGKIDKTNPNKVRDLFFNCIYIQGCYDLAYLCDQIGDNEQSTKFHQRARKMERFLIKNCWNRDDNLYYGLDDAGKIINDIKTSCSLIPIILDNIPNSHIHCLIDNYILNEQEFYTEYPIPILSQNVSIKNDNKKLKNSKELIRLDLNWLIIRGLQKHGFYNVAMELSQKTIDIVRKFGFWEYYHTHEGIGIGMSEYTPSTIIVDIEDKIFGSDLDFIFNQEWNRIKKLPDF
ncbi:MAG: hypothetical protein GF317_04990 [Candidatus Lokiarchaeota archaeon]|nr:hypothetical protein [Candidatus Lokiarchaeota archaeon]MBD3199161.1 hypothetical protein [Candidatus Lokiarchaeota archaeon]